MKCTKREIITKKRNVVTKEVYEEDDNRTCNSIVACVICSLLFVFFLVLGITRW